MKLSKESDIARKPWLKPGKRAWPGGKKACFWGIWA